MDINDTTGLIVDICCTMTHPGDSLPSITAGNTNIYGIMLFSTYVLLYLGEKVRLINVK